MSRISMPGIGRGSGPFIPEGLSLGRGLQLTEGMRRGSTSPEHIERLSSKISWSNFDFRWPSSFKIKMNVLGEHLMLERTKGSNVISLTAVDNTTRIRTTISVDNKTGSIFTSASCLKRLGTTPVSWANTFKDSTEEKILGYDAALFALNQRISKMKRELKAKTIVVGLSDSDRKALIALKLMHANFSKIVLARISH